MTSSTAGHTAGNWCLDGVYVVDENNATIADCGKSPSISRPEKVANARLIAAAPELLATLESIVAEIHPNTGGTQGAIRKAAAAAIADAKGGAA